MGTITHKAGWIIAAVLGLFVVAALAGVARGGPLDPPGAPAPTQPPVEPRTPISALPFTISQPGSYFLTQNLTASAGGDGITVLADNVTIDLNGFALTGIAGSASAISEGGSAPPHSGWVVKNGSIENWPNGSGAFAVHVSGGRYEDLHIKAAGHEGINAGPQSMVQRVTVEGDANAGLILRASSNVSDCSVKRATSGGQYGIYVEPGSTLTRCTVESYASGIVAWQNSKVTDCVVRNGSADGVNAFALSTVRNCFVSSFAGKGIIVRDNGSAVDNRVDGTWIGLQIVGSGGLVEGNLVTNLTGFWLDVELGTGNIALHNRLHSTGDASVCASCSAAIAPYEYTKPPTFDGTNPNANIVY